MKKALTLALIIIVSVAFTALEAKIDPLKTINQKITLVHPAHNSFVNHVPLEINFKWVPIAGITQYSLIVQIQEGLIWKNHYVRPNLTGDNVTVTYDQAKGFRWHVVGMGARGVVFESPWWMVQYKPGMTRSSATSGNVAAGDAMAGGQVQNKPEPQFHPVPLTPKHNAVLKNFPRHMTFTWMHSTNPQYRNYQLQVDIFHVTSKRWRSQLKGRTFLLDTMVNENRYDFEFTADRLGRWRVRGVNGNNEFTPWSVWRQFRYNARH